MRSPPARNVKDFFDFINERHSIYLRRQKGQQWPWTKDPILQKHKFCNVFRELDKVTIWIRENWREPYNDHPHLWFAMAVARLINWPDTLEEIGFPSSWKPRRFVRVIDDRIERRQKTFTSAYRGPLPRPGNDVSRGHYLAYDVLDPLFHDPLPLQRARTLQKAWKMLRGRPGFRSGGFVAYEVVTELRHTRYLRNAKDVMTWANAGPGAMRGLNRIWCRPTSEPLDGDQALDEMRHLLEVSQQHLGKHVPSLEMRDIEHSLCEFDKYHRAQIGEGTVPIYRREEFQPLL